MFYRFILPGFLTAIEAYLLGSISFSIIITRKFASVDVRSVGSGNAGATNVLRAAGKKASALTFLLDFSKCVVAMFLGSFLFRLFAGFCEETATTPLSHYFGLFMGGIFCLLGHIYPLYFQFRGGKGVVTCAAMIAIIDWRVFLIGITLFLLIVLITRMVSLGSIIAMTLYPVVTFLITYFGDYKQLFWSRHEAIPFSFVIASTVFACVLTIVILLTHIPNIKRIIKGTESKINFDI